MSATRYSVRSWALVAVAVTTMFLIGMSVWFTSILSGRDWCNRAIGAAEYVDGRPAEAIAGCFSLLNAQLKAIAWNSHIAISIIALSLLTLVVIVLAGGRLSFKASASGVSADMSHEESEAKGAQETAEAAVEVAEEKAQVAEGAAPVRPKPDNPDG